MKCLPPAPPARMLALSLSIAFLAACAHHGDKPETATWSWRDATSARAVTPDQAYPELFVAVQQGKLFSDQKHFVDALPKRDPAAIRRDYLAQRNQPGFDLKAFVAANFEESGQVTSPPPRANVDLATHIKDLWPVLTRSAEEVPAYSSLLPLPKPYVVPGGRFREVYYWDSYFTMLGLAKDGERGRVRDMVDNFAYEIDTYGHIPNGNRSYYLSRSQPPFFAYMVDLQASLEGDSAYRRYLPELQKEYAYWMAGAQDLQAGQAKAHVIKLADGTLLNRYWDANDTPRQESYMEDLATAAQAKGRPAGEVYRDLRAGAESGWDFSSRWLADGKTLATIRTTALAPVDLNSLLYHLERTIAKACEKTGDATCVQAYSQKAKTRQQAIDRYLWNPAGYYTDFDWQAKRRTDTVTAATLFPLFVGLASQSSADQTAATVANQLLRPGGLATTTVKTGQQWDEPNGWAPLQWVAVDGLRRYQQNKLAADIGTRFLTQVQNLYNREQKLVEKYDLTGGQGGGGGEYQLQDGFGWTNGVTLKLLELYKPQSNAQ